VTVNVDGTLNYTPNANYSGTDTITYTVSDGNDGTSTATATVDVVAVNDAPVAIDDTISITVLNNITVSKIFSSSFEEYADSVVLDSGGETFHIDSIDGWINTNNGEAIELRDGSVSGSAFDGQKYIELNTDPDNYFLDASSISRAIDTINGASYELDFNFSARPGYDDTICRFEILVDNQILGTYSADGSGNATTVWNNDSVSFVGTGNLMTLEFRDSSVDISGGRGIFLDVISLNQIINQGTGVEINVLGNDTDIDGDTLTVTSATANNGTVTINAGGTLTYVGNQDFNGTEIITYTIDDGNGGTDTATVTFDVVDTAAVNTAPVATNDTATTDEDTAVTIDVLTNDTDADSADILSGQ